MAEESPFIEEGKTETKEEQAPDTDGLLDELKNAGVSNTAELQNKLRASAEVGNLAYKLGEERKANETLSKRIEALESTPATTEDLSTDYGQPIDLSGEIAKGVKKVLSEEKEANAVAQRNMMVAWNTIQNDEDFHLVKPVWEEKLKDPNFVFAVQNGQVNPIAEYQNTLRTFYKGMMQKSAETIEKMQGKKVTTPNVETGGNVAAAVEDGADQDKALESFQKKIDTGGQLSEAEELAALQASFLK